MLATVPAGTVVNSHCLHFDPVGQPGSFVVVEGSAVFGEDVLGIIILGEDLRASDDTIGAFGTVYPSSDGGFELPSQDFVILQSDMRTVIFHGEATSHVDEIRVVTASSAGGFANDLSWATFDPSNHGVGDNPIGYHGGAYDGRFVYLAPIFSGGGGGYAEVLRYDTQQAFATTGAWATFDIGSSGVGTDPVGFVGAIFDGQYVYFVPWRNSSSDYHGEVARYDTLAPFSNPGSWSAYDPGEDGVGVDPRRLSLRRIRWAIHLSGPLSQWY